MGLSSSQGRLLMLTSRLSDIELQEIIISQRQNQLAWQAQKVAQEYNDALSNCKLVIKIPDASESKGYKTEDLSYKNMTDMGYLVTDGNNNIYLQKDENGDWIIPKDIDNNNLLTIDANGKAVIGNNKYEIKDGTKYLGDTNVLQNSIMNGVLYIYNTNNQEAGISSTNLGSDTNMEYVLDTTDDAQAQSKYEYETASISRKDNQLDMDLAQLETQHDAVIKEYDSVKKLIENNVERTFKLFSNG